MEGSNESDWAILQHQTDEEEQVCSQAGSQARDGFGIFESVEHGRKDGR